MITTLANLNNEAAVHHLEIQGLQVDKDPITRPGQIANANTPQNLVDHLPEDLHFLLYDHHVYPRLDIGLNLIYHLILAITHLPGSPNVEEHGVHLQGTGAIEILVTEEGSAGQEVGKDTISEKQVLQADVPFHPVATLHGPDL